MKACHYLFAFDFSPALIIRFAPESTIKPMKITSIITHAVLRLKVDTLATNGRSVFISADSKKSPRLTVPLTIGAET